MTFVPKQSEQGIWDCFHSVFSSRRQRMSLNSTPRRLAVGSRDPLDLLGLVEATQ